MVDLGVGGKVLHLILGKLVVKMLIASKWIRFGSNCCLSGTR